jgi:hypothetical protein
MKKEGPTRFIKMIPLDHMGLVLAFYWCAPLHGISGWGDWQFSWYSTGVSWWQYTQQLAVPIRKMVHWCLKPAWQVEVTGHWRSVVTSVVSRWMHANWMFKPGFSLTPRALGKPGRARMQHKVFLMCMRKDEIVSLEDWTQEVAKTVAGGGGQVYTTRREGQ